jgi:hypothetical protein
MPSLRSGRSADYGIFGGNQPSFEIPETKLFECKTGLWSVKALFERKIIHSLGVSTYNDLCDKSSLAVMHHSFFVDSNWVTIRRAI